jgi:hypothetical protein
LVLCFHWFAGKLGNVPKTIKRCKIEYCMFGEKYPVAVKRHTLYPATNADPMTVNPISSTAKIALLMIDSLWLHHKWRDQYSFCATS